MFAGTFAPVGWMLCNGQLLPIADYSTLFNLIGTTYGGDGQNTFALPNIQSRLPIHQSSSFPLGATGGVEQVALTVAQIPAHSHTLQASTDTGTQSTPTGYVPAANNTVKLYATGTAATTLAGQAITNAGNSLPHDNRQPYLCVNFIISLFGIYPTQN